MKRYAKILLALGSGALAANLLYMPVHYPTEERIRQKNTVLSEILGYERFNYCRYGLLSPEGRDCSGDVDESYSGWCCDGSISVRKHDEWSYRRIPRNLSEFTAVNSSAIELSGGIGLLLAGILIGRKRK